MGEKNPETYPTTGLRKDGNQVTKEYACFATAYHPYTM